MSSVVLCSIEPVSIVLNPDERGTVAWNQAFMACSPIFIEPKVSGLLASKSQIKIKATIFSVAIALRISLLFGVSLLQRLFCLTSIKTRKPIPPNVYSVLMVKQIR